MNCMWLIIPSNKNIYNFYLNKLFKFFILLNEIIMTIKTYNKLILNMYSLFSKFYCIKFFLLKN